MEEERKEEGNESVYVCVSVVVILNMPVFSIQFWGQVILVLNKISKV